MWSTFDEPGVASMCDHEMVSTLAGQLEGFILPGSSHSRDRKPSQLAACVHKPWRAGKRSKMWSTFNEPGVASMCGWVSGNHPPGKILQFRVSPAPFPTASQATGEAIHATNSVQP